MQIADNIEMWRLINSYDNYEVSSHGRVRNNKTMNILKPSLNQGGYYQISLHKNGKKKSTRIHQVVAEAYCEMPIMYDCIDHIDRNKKNNHYKNLRYCTSSENMKNMTTPKTNTSGIKGVKFNEKKNEWRCQWVDNEGVRHDRSFIVGINGHEHAKERAIECRKKHEKECGYL